MQEHPATPSQTRGKRGAKGGVAAVTPLAKTTTTLQILPFDAFRSHRIPNTHPHPRVEGVAVGHSTLFTVTHEGALTALVIAEGEDDVEAIVPPQQDGVILVPDKAVRWILSTLLPPSKQLDTLITHWSRTVGRMQSSVDSTGTLSRVRVVSSVADTSSSVPGFGSSIKNDDHTAFVPLLRLIELLLNLMGGWAKLDATQEATIQYLKAILTGTHAGLPIESGQLRPPHFGLV